MKKIFTWQNFNESKTQKLKSHEIKNIAIKSVTSAIDAEIGGNPNFFDEWSEEDADKIKAEIDKICVSLEKKIKK